jgi:nitroimidazol reductase NimA-like FMN-containing flavoprotein (pyridoxamine 5'-phosphate oxidase superfamily)
MAEFPITSKNKIKRKPDRGTYDQETIYKILDEGLICHVGLIQENSPIVIPMNYARHNDQILLHGAPASRLLQSIKSGTEVCITITLLDSLVLARSVMHHSMNYRSVVIFGKGFLVEDYDQKKEALKSIVEHIIPGRWDDARQPSEKEIKQTCVVSIPIDEASAKIRSGPVIDEEEDYDLRVWAGLLPMELMPGSVEADARLANNINIPDYLKNYKRGK